MAINWTAVSGATSYTVYRTANNSTYTSVGTPGTNSFTDNTAAASTAYFYKVTATGSGGTSGDSNKDLATTVIFTDDPLPDPSQQPTVVKVVHFTQLRTAVNAVVVLAGISAIVPFPTYTDPTLTTSMQVKAVHLTELRANLNAARSSLNLSALTYTDTTITSQTMTPIRVGSHNSDGAPPSRRLAGRHPAAPCAAPRFRRQDAAEPAGRMPALRGSTGFVCKAALPMPPRIADDRLILQPSPSTDRESL